MKNPLQKRIHQPQDPMVVMQQAQQKKAKEESEAARKKAETILLPLFLKSSENVLDAVVWANTLSQKIQEIAADTAVKMKVKEYKKELVTNTTANHGQRYDAVIDALEEMPVHEAVLLLKEIKTMVNDGINKKLNKLNLQEFIEKKQSILT